MIYVTPTFHINSLRDGRFYVAKVRFKRQTTVAGDYKLANCNATPLATVWSIISNF